MVDDRDEMILFSYDKENDGCGSKKETGSDHGTRLFRFQLTRVYVFMDPLGSSNSSNNGDENDVDESKVSYPIQPPPPPPPLPPEDKAPAAESEPAPTIATTSLTWTWTLILAGPLFQRQRRQVWNLETVTQRCRFFDWSGDDVA
jgi:hypothetical protein